MWGLQGDYGICGFCLGSSAWLSLTRLLGRELFGLPAVTRLTARRSPTLSLELLSSVLACKKELKCRLLFSFRSFEGLVSTVRTMRGVLGLHGGAEMKPHDGAA